jgi:hypothetical protein
MSACPAFPARQNLWEAYRAATGQIKPAVTGASGAKAGTVAAIVGPKYLTSAGFANLADETRRTRRNILERQIATL